MQNYTVEMVLQTFNLYCKNMKIRERGTERKPPLISDEWVLLPVLYSGYLVCHIVIFQSSITYGDMS